MKKFIILLTLIAVVTGLALSGCAGTAPTPAPAPAPAVQVPPEPTGQWPSPNPYWGLGFKPDGTRLHFIYSSPTMHNAWIATAARLLETWSVRSGATINIYNAEFDIPLQMSVIEDSIILGPDALIVWGIDAAVAPSVNKATDAGIPVFNFDNPIPGARTVTYAHHDMYEMSRLAGQFLVDKAEELGTPLKVYELWGFYSMEIAQIRHRGFREAVDGSPWIVEVVESPDCQFGMCCLSLLY